MTRFDLVNATQRVIFGAGALERLGEAVAGFGWERVLLCTIPRFQASGLADRTAGILGGRLAAVFAEAEPHVPEAQVEAAARLARDCNADAVLGLGGGSPIGLAKAVAMALVRAQQAAPLLKRRAENSPPVAVIAIPTTYAGSEMTPIYGITRLVDGAPRKITQTDPRATPKLVIYDPELTLDLPAQMTGSSGINALAHCIEAVYSTTRNPIATAAALAGTRLICSSLRQAVADGHDLAARTALMEGAYLAGTAIATARIGLHHGLCHVLGGTAGVPHGIANAVMLPHAMRFNARGAAAELAAIARAMGLEGEEDAGLAEEACRAVYNLVAAIGLPQRLRDIGVAEADLAGLAEAGMSSSAVKNNPVAVTDAGELEAVFRAAW